MRHGLAGNKFGRNQTLRAATLRDLARAVFKHERIRTTRAKAVEARKLVDRLITLGKENTLAAKRRAFSVLIDHGLVSALFNTIAPRFKNRQGGYTRLIKFAVNRPGDNAEMVLLELTERAAPKTDDKKVEDAEVVDAVAKPAQKTEKKAVKKAEKKPEVKKEEKKAEKKPAKKAATK
ncbi:MAG: 50S ribosomal protein L17 [Candidatus Omnitrophica bacterium]|nr:50S ribosomal protein L17 [Candidatus Omnitrophota bacterium]